MKKKLLSAAIITLSIFALTGCNAIKQKQLDAEFLSDIEALPDNVIEDNSEASVVTADTSEEEYELEEGWWCVAYTRDDEDPNDRNIYIENLQPIRRDFPINSKSTFGELTDVCAKYDAHFSKDAFNNIFAANYFSEDNYKDTYEKYAEADTITVVTRMYMIACFMGSNQLSIESVTCLFEENENTRTYYCKDPAGNDFEVTWDVATGSLTAYAPSTGKSMDAGMNLNDDMILLTYSMEVKEGYKVGEEEQSVDEYFEQKEQKSQEEGSDNVYADVIKKIDYCDGYENDIIKAVEAYYGSPVSLVTRNDSKSISTSPAYDIQTKNGDVCLLVASKSMVTVHSSDDQLIWSSR